MAIRNQTMLILGATGQVGQQLLSLALQNSAVGHVVAPTRRPLTAHEKLFNPIVDFDNLPRGADWWRADAVLCAIGTTLRQAGSQAAFRRIDHDYVEICAALAHQAGTPAFVYVSSVGANANAGSFYLRVKGETERAIGKQGFASVCHVRPSLLDVDTRNDFRLGEKIGIQLFRLLKPIIPLHYRAVTPAVVAGAALAAALAAEPGVKIIESRQLHDV